MKIGIAGNYGHANLGDEALLLGALELAHKDAGIAAKDIVVLSDNKKDTESRLLDKGYEIRRLKRPYGGNVFRLPLVAKDIFRALDGLDWLVFGGGGLLNDSNRTAIPLFVLIRVLAWLRGVRIAWWSIGIGPLDGRMHRYLGAWLLRSSQFVTLRDEHSLRLASEISGLDFQLAPDLAHAVTVSDTGDVNKGRAYVAMSVIPLGKAGFWFRTNDEGYAHYCREIAKTIDGILRENADIQIHLFSVSLQQDSVAIEDIIRVGEFESNERVIQIQASSVESLLTDLSGATAVVATRLHSVVLATLAGVPCITVAYQPKVRSYASELPTQLPCFKIEDFSSEEVIDACSGLLLKAGAYASTLESENKLRRTRLRESVLSWKQIT